MHLSRLMAIAVLIAGPACFVAPCLAQEIVAFPLSKEPPTQIPGGGIQIDLYNQTPSRQSIRVREPGGNWYVFAVPASSGVNLRCGQCGQHLEAVLSNRPGEPVILNPGTVYDLKRAGGDQHLVLVPRRPGRMTE